MAGGLLTKRALVLAKIETTTGVDAAPTPEADAILVSEPSFTTDPQVLQRNFVSNDLSKFEHAIGRVVAGMSFKVDIRGNGRQDSGLVADAPKLATLMRACGYEISSTNGTGSQNQTDAIPSKDNDAFTTLSWAKGGSVTLMAPVLYTIEVTTGGASGVAQVMVTGNNDLEDDLTPSSPQTLTQGAAINLGTKGGTITPTFGATTTVALGDKWQVLAYPVGVKLRPRSTAFETITLWMYRDGILHKGQAGMGSFTIEAQAGEYASATFNFTTTFSDPIDVVMPSNPNYETTIPQQVELSLLSWGGNKDMFAESWSFDAGNEINARMDVNARQGYLGSRISDRAPTGGFTPEAQLESDEPFWADYLAGKSKTFTARIGTVQGNSMVFFAPNAQTSEQSYGDRNGIMTYDKSMGFKRGLNGDDEAIFIFC